MLRTPCIMPSGSIYVAGGFTIHCYYLLLALLTLPLPFELPLRYHTNCFAVVVVYLRAAYILPLRHYCHISCHDILVFNIYTYCHCFHYLFSLLISICLLPLYYHLPHHYFIYHRRHCYYYCSITPHFNIFTPLLHEDILLFNAMLHYRAYFASLSSLLPFVIFHYQIHYYDIFH